MANPNKKDGFLFPRITDLKSAQKVGRQGSIACVLLILSAIIGNLATSPTGTLSQNIIIGGSIYFVLMVSIFKMSRVGAIVALLFFSAAMISMLIGGAMSNFIVCLVLGVYLCCFINGVRGTFAYHRIRSERRSEIEQPEVSVH